MNRPILGEHSLAHQCRKLWNKLWVIEYSTENLQFPMESLFGYPPYPCKLQTISYGRMPICSQCLALARGKIQKSSSEALNFYLLAITMVDRLAVKELELWAMISWSLWNPKNRLFSLKSQPAVILRGATSLLEEYQWLALAGPHR